MEEFKDEIHRTQKKENWRIDEYKSEFTTPTAQKILKLGGSNKGI